MDYISQFTTDIRYSPGKENVVADALSRIDAITLPISFPYEEIAKAQREDNTLKELVQSEKTSLQLKPVLINLVQRNLFS